MDPRSRVDYTIHYQRSQVSVDFPTEDLVLRFAATREKLVGRRRAVEAEASFRRPRRPQSHPKAPRATLQPSRTSQGAAGSRSRPPSDAIGASRPARAASEAVSRFQDRFSSRKRPSHVPCCPSDRSSTVAAPTCFPWSPSNRSPTKQPTTATNERIFLRS